MPETKEETRNDFSRSLCSLTKSKLNFENNLTLKFARNCADRGCKYDVKT